MSVFNKKNNSFGFTLIEIVVSLSIFITVLTLSLGSLLLVLDSFRKAQLLRATIENVNIAVETMAKNIRTGDLYHCISGIDPENDPDIESPQDCPFDYILETGGGEHLAFRLKDRQIVYKWDSSKKDIRISDTIPGSDITDTYKPITSPEIEITSLKFYVSGNADINKQPFVTITVSGKAAIQGKAGLDTFFRIQTSASQRSYFDISNLTS